MARCWDSLQPTLATATPTRCPPVPRPTCPSQPFPPAGWFGTIFELDGVCVEYECGDGGRSWQALAAEEGKPPPPLWALKKADGMKNEQVCFG